MTSLTEAYVPLSYPVQPHKLSNGSNDQLQMSEPRMEPSEMSDDEFDDKNNHVSKDSHSGKSKSDMGEYPLIDSEIEVVNSVSESSLVDSDH